MLSSLPLTLSGCFNTGEGATGRGVRSFAWSTYTPALPPGWPTPAKPALGGNYKQVRIRMRLPAVDVVEARAVVERLEDDLLPEVGGADRVVDP